MHRFAGCCRYVWNKALALEKERYAQGEKYLGYYELTALLTKWRHTEETSFLAETNCDCLQQSLRNLDNAYKNFFAKRADLPKFKKKIRHATFRYVKCFKFDESNSRIYLPKLGWMHYRASRKIKGIPKNVTVSKNAGKWYVSIQTERIVAEPVHPSQSAVGIDLGVVNFATLSDGTVIKPVNSYKQHRRKISRLKRKLARCRKFSSNWHKLDNKIGKLYEKMSNIRRDFLHKTSTTISKNHAVVVLEDLKVQQMLRSAGYALRSAILDQGWAEFRRMLTYKLAWRGGKLIVVPPPYTSQTCNYCGCIDRANRKTQAHFQCTTCGHELNADLNAALNILAAGHAAAACPGNREAAAARLRLRVGDALAPAMKQEPALLAA